MHQIQTRADYVVLRIRVGDERPEEVVGLLEVLAHREDLVDQVLHALRGRGGGGAGAVAQAPRAGGGEGALRARPLIIQRRDSRRC